MSTVTRTEVALAAPTLDRNQLLADAGGDVELILRLTDMFGEQCSRLLAELHGAVAEADARRVNFVAHALKGTLGYWLTGRAFELAAQLESMGHRGELADAMRAEAELRIEARALSAEVDAFAAALLSSCEGR